MKTLYCISFFALVGTTFAQDAERITRSRITEATVFLKGAQITRTSTQEVPRGTTVFVLEGISPRITEESIQVEAPASLKILSVSFRVNHLQTVRKSDQIQILEKERTKLKELVSAENSTQNVYVEEEAMLKANKAIGGQQLGVNINDLKSGVEFFRQRLTDIKQRQQELAQHIVTYEERIVLIDNQLTQLKNQKPQPSGEIVIKVNAKNPATATFTISYLVHDARWFPSYDIRASNISSPIDIAYKANVSQQSGEDWESVVLTISSGNPSDTGAKPILQPWYLGFNNSFAASLRQTVAGLQLNQNEIRGRVVGSDGEGLPGVNIVIKGTSVGTVTNSVGVYTLPLTADARSLVVSFIGYASEEVQITGQKTIDVQLNEDITQLSEVVVTGFGGEGGSGSYGYSREPRVKKSIVATPVVRQVNVEFRIEEPYSIRSDGENHTVDMIEYEVDALYEYYCAPKLDQDAFLTARLIHWDEYNFLEGEASLFFEGKYLGKSILDTRNVNDTLTISLGRDKNVLVTREKKKDLSSRQLIGANQKASLAYEISIRNKKGQPLNIVVEDQVPIPNNKDINVDKLEDSEAEYDEETGLLKWRREVAPGKTVVIDLKYVVRYPKQSTMILE